MKQRWEVKKLGEVCLISTGKSNTEDAVENGNYAFFDRSKIIKKSSKYLFDCDAIIVAGEGQTFLPKFYSGKFDLHQRAYAIFNFDKDVSVHYVYKYLIHFHKYFAEVAVGATAKSLRLRHFQDLPIPIPSLHEQQRIVEILDEVFDGIAKAKANAEQNLKNAQELFESYLQSIKADKNSLGDIVDIKTGKLNSNEAVKNGKYPFFTCSRDVFAIDKFAFDCEAILLAGNNASGDFNVKHYAGKFNAYQRTYVITVNNKNKVLYRYLYFQLLNSLKEFKEKSVGANTQFLKIGMIQEMQISLPSIQEQQTIVQKLDALSLETKKLETIYRTKIADLEELKKSILHKAFNGELK